MEFIKLCDNLTNNYLVGVTERNLIYPRILIFTEGTILGPKHWWQWLNDKGYISIGKSVEKIRKWNNQGAKISYLTSRRKLKDVYATHEILLKENFTGTYLFYRSKNEKYHEIAELILPDILIEDDCRSIGGRWQMTITHLSENAKEKIRTITVREFAGIDHLPDDLTTLISKTTYSE